LDGRSWIILGVAAASATRHAALLDHHLGDARQVIAEARQGGGISSTRELFRDPLL
jgi:hypothetical protein